MSKTDTGNRAYPKAFQGHDGMTVLDHAAIEIAKARIIHSGTPYQNGVCIDDWAETNYDMAEAMIKAKRARE